MCLEDQETIARNNSKSLQRNNSGQQISSAKEKQHFLNPPLEFVQNSNPKANFNYNSIPQSTNKNDGTIIARLNSTNFKNTNPPVNFKTSPTVNYPAIPYAESNYRSNLGSSYNFSHVQANSNQQNFQTNFHSSSNQQNAYFNKSYLPSVNSPFDSSGYVVPKSSQEERFSEFKFGKITLDSDKNKASKTN